MARRAQKPHPIDPTLVRRPCARCKVNLQMHVAMGCLCEDCENAIDGMTEAELELDWIDHNSPVIPDA